VLDDSHDVTVTVVTSSATLSLVRAGADEIAGVVGIETAEEISEELTAETVVVSAGADVSTGPAEVVSAGADVSTGAAEVVSTTGSAVVVSTGAAAPGVVERPHLVPAAPRVVP